MSAWREATIERIERPTKRVVSVFLRADFPSYEAGQHVDVRLTAPDGYQAQRSYSIASAPGAPLLELAIETLEGGEVSPYFQEVAQAGDTFEIRGPIGGHFIWRAADGGPIVLLGGGSGVVPLMSIARHRAAVDSGAKMLLVYSARTWEEIIFRDELLALDSAHDGLRVVFATTRGPRGRPGDLDRRLDGAALRTLLAQWGEVPVRSYVCGSNRFVESATAGLIEGGLAPETIRVERYGSVVATPA